jgi:hypothetical protein
MRNECSVGLQQIRSFGADQVKYASFWPVLNAKEKERTKKLNGLSIQEKENS